MLCKEKKRKKLWWSGMGGEAKSYWNEVRLKKLKTQEI